MTDVLDGLALSSLFEPVSQVNRLNLSTAAMYSMPYLANFYNAASGWVGEVNDLSVPSHALDRESLAIPAADHCPVISQLG